MIIRMSCMVSFLIICMLSLLPDGWAHVGLPDPGRETPEVTGMEPGEDEVWEKTDLSRVYNHTIYSLKNHFSRRTNICHLEIRCHSGRQPSPTWRVAMGEGNDLCYLLSSFSTCLLCEQVFSQSRSTLKLMHFLRPSIVASGIAQHIIMIPWTSFYYACIHII